MCVSRTHEWQVSSSGAGKDSFCGWHPKYGSELRNAPPLLAAGAWGTSLGMTGSHFSWASLLPRGRGLSHHAGTCACFEGDSTLGDVRRKARFWAGEAGLKACSEDRACLPAGGASSSPTRPCGGKGRTRHWPRLGICLLWREARRVAAARATGCCLAADDRGCVPQRISPWGLNLGGLPHTPVYAKAVRSDVAWCEFSFFYKQLFECKTAQCKTRANSSAVMQSTTNVHAQVQALLCLLGALCEISPGVGNYPGNQGSETMFTDDLTASLQLYINSFSWSWLKSFRWVESRKELQRLRKKQQRYLREKIMTKMKESTLWGRTWVKNCLCTFKTLAWAYSYCHTLIMFHSSNVKRKSCKEYRIVGSDKQ